MVRIGKKRAWLYSISPIMITISTVLIAILSFVNDVEKSDKWLSNKPVVWLFFERTQDYIGLLYLIIFAIFITFTLIQRTSNPWVWKQLQFILNEYQEKVFTDFDDPNDHHRVTLFKVQKFCFFKKHWSRKSKFSKPSGKHPIFSDYLVPVLRSGHMSQKSNAIFYVCDESDKCEGVVGQAWSTKSTAIAPNLPEVSGARVGQSTIKRYSKETFTDEALINRYINEGRVPPRSIAAIVIEVNNEPWGVIVLDSRRPDGVSYESVQNYSLTASMIGRLLEEV